jgi:hypothetical protein
MKDYEFAELDRLSVSELDEVLESKRAELLEAERERHQKIGAILFTQDAIHKARSK